MPAPGSFATAVLKPFAWLYSAAAVPFVYTLSFGSADRLLRVSERLNEGGSFLHHVLRSIYYERLKMYREARESSHRALEINDRNHVPYLNLASSLCFLGRYEEAMEYCNRALAMGRPDEKWKAMALSTRVDVYIALGKMVAAKEDVETIFQLMKKDPIALAARAKVSDAQGDYQRALEDLNNAIENCEPMDLPGLLEQRGAVYARLSGPDAAATDRLKASEIRNSWLNETRLFSAPSFQSSLVRNSTAIMFFALVTFAFLNRESTLGLMLLPLFVIALFRRCAVGLVTGAIVGVICLATLGMFVPIRFWENTQAQPVSFKTQTLAGKPFNLDGWKGKSVLIYYAPSGEVETDDTKSLKAVFNKYPRTKLEIVGIVDGGTTKTVAKTPWPIVAGNGLDSKSKSQLDNLEKVNTYLLSPLDHHIVARSSHPDGINVPLDWIMKSQVDLKNYSQSEVRVLSWILDILVLVPVLIFMVLDRTLQKFVTGLD